MMIMAFWLHSYQRFITRILFIGGIVLAHRFNLSDLNAVRFLHYLKGQL